jgi:hypothetical protein
MSQDHPGGEGFDELDQPFVAGGGFNDGLERAEFVKEVSDGLDVRAQKAFGDEDISIAIDHADEQRSLVKVNAGELHGELLVWKRELGAHTPFRFTTISSIHPPA